MTAMQDDLSQAQAHAAKCDAERSQAVADLGTQQLAAKTWEAQCKALQEQVAALSTAAMEKETSLQAALTLRQARVDELETCEVRACAALVWLLSVRLQCKGALSPAA